MSSNVKIMKIKVDEKSPAVGCTLRDIAENGKFLVLMMQKNGSDEYFIPIGSTKIEVGLPIPVVITVYNDKSFTFIMKTPPAAILLKKAAGIQKGSAVPNKNKVGKLTRAQLEEIATTKEPDLTGADLDARVRTIAGSARSMGLEVEL